MRKQLMNKKFVIAISGVLILSLIIFSYLTQKNINGKLSSENMLLTEKINGLTTENEKLKNELNTSVSKEENNELWDRVRKISTQNKDLESELVSIKEELERRKSWKDVSNYNQTSMILDTSSIIGILDRVQSENLPPIYGVIVCDMYINELRSEEARTEMVYKLHKQFVDWEAYYTKSIKELIVETDFVDEDEQVHLENKAIELIASDNTVLHQLKDEKFKSIMIEAKYSSYSAVDEDGISSFEYDRSFLIERYGNLIKEDLTAYMKLEDMMNSEISWYSSDVAYRRLEFIQNIKDKFFYSEYKTLSLQEIETYEEEINQHLGITNK